MPRGQPPPTTLADAVLLDGPPLPEFKGRPGWEFTDLTGLDFAAYEPAPPAAGGEPLLDAPAADPGSDGVVVLDLAEARELHPDLVDRYLGKVVAGEDPFVARNEAAWQEGLFVWVPRGVRATAPVVRNVAVAAGRALHHRALIVLDEGAEAEVWEQYLSTSEDTDGLFNGVTEIVVGPNSRLRYVCGQGVDEKSWVFGTQRAVVDRDGALDWVALGFGSARGKVRMETELRGPGASAKVTGAYAGRGRQHLDFDTTQEHSAPSTTSDLAFRGVLSGRATAVWRGMIRVDRGAQQTDAFQESRNLLLSKRAHADAIPGLEIEANDVRCTHAAAIAQVDREQVFYLMSRGLRREQATRLVIDGFLQALVERFPQGAIHDALAAALERRLEAVLQP
ncbi:MAG: Fe-S cluster assembly protein SufD [Actinobacteria bacterium]|nr:Fe-S cluster assembly protein SufD [Actinomycetota bacterium]